MGQEKIYHIKNKRKKGEKMGERIRYAAIPKGTKIGHWTVGDPVRKGKYKTMYYHCVCDCGTERDVLSHNLRHNLTYSCGCAREKFRPAEDLTGQDFGFLHVEEKIVKDRHTYFRCKCKCGGEIIATGSYLRAGRVKSCGCRIGMKERTKEYNEKGMLSPRVLKNAANKNSQSGYVGVNWNRQTNRWMASIIFRGKTHYLGTFENVEDAIMARKIAEEKYYGELLKNSSGENYKELMKNIGFGGEIPEEEVAEFNRRIMLKKNPSGHVGVSWMKSTGKWKATLCRDGRQYHLGYFDNIEDAVAAREEAEEKYDRGEPVNKLMRIEQEWTVRSSNDEDADDEEEEEEDFIGFDEGWDDEE